MTSVQSRAEHNYRNTFASVRVCKCFFFRWNSSQLSQRIRCGSLKFSSATVFLQYQQKRIGMERGNSKWSTDLVLGQGWLGLAIRSLALTIIPSHRGATGRGRHTRHGADLCNLVCLCRWHTRRNQLLLRRDGEPAHF